MHIDQYKFDYFAFFYKIIVIHAKKDGLQLRSHPVLLTYGISKGFFTYIQFTAMLLPSYPLQDLNEKACTT